MKRQFYLLILALLSFSSCKTGKVDLKRLENNGPVILTMERTPCYGKCPVYQVKLYDNGLLTYEGKHFTELAGCHYAKVSKQEIAALTAYFEKEGFFNLENKYPVGEPGPTDLPGCRIFFKSGTNEKQIDDKGWQTPAGLIAMGKRVDSLVASKKLQFCDK